jgi:hypothetical protein
LAVPTAREALGITIYLGSSFSNLHQADDFFCGEPVGDGGFDHDVHGGGSGLSEDNVSRANNLLNSRRL